MSSNERLNEISERIKKNRRRRRMYRLTVLLFALFLMVFLGAAGGIIIQLRLDMHDAQLYEGLSELVTDPTEEESENSGFEDHRQETTGDDQIPDDTEMEILPRYQTVYEMNQDLYGWIYLEGTTLNYPVMCTPEDEEYYLRRGFDREYSRSGVPFLDGGCVPGNGNYIIYGHNMNNGTMFAPLIAYEAESFWREHPVIRFDTLYERGQYEIVSVFYSRVFYKSEQNVFRYYDYTNLSDQAVFHDFVEQAKGQALYETGVEPEYGDQLITLITCSYGIKNERFVIVARQIMD